MAQQAGEGKKIVAKLVVSAIAIIFLSSASFSLSVGGAFSAALNDAANACVDAVSS